MDNIIKTQTMPSYQKGKINPTIPLDLHRRDFIRKGAILSTLTGIGGLGMITGCSGSGEKIIGPAEVLMREHGVLNRVMMVYDACRNRLIIGEPFSAEALQQAAQIIRTYIEDYHEKLEEEFLFPKFVNADRLVGLNQLLYVQHAAGKKLTDEILQLANENRLKDDADVQKLISLLNSFNWMYRSHESREDTVLFPALREIVSKNEYDSLGEDFEKRGNELLGKDGFEAYVLKVENIEKQLGINDMAQLTPTLPISPQ